jgi:hypothetical protein
MWIIPMIKDKMNSVITILHSCCVDGTSKSQMTDSTSGRKNVPQMSMMMKEPQAFTYPMPVRIDSVSSLTRKHPYVCPNGINNDDSESGRKYALEKCLKEYALA